MASNTTERVKRHRIARGIVRVEVEVPSTEDALAVRRFALSRRQAAKRRPALISESRSSVEPSPGGLEATLGRLPPAGLAAVERFAGAIAGASTPTLIERATAMAGILEEAARRAQAAAVIEGEGRAI